MEILIKNVYKLKKGYLYIKPENCWNFENDYLVNGKEPIKTFKNDFYYTEKEITKIEQKKKIKINERWELKNKDLYNKNIPMLIDESTKEVFNSLIEDDLYNYTCEEKDIKENISFQITSTIDIDVNDRFNEYEIREVYQSWHGWQKVKKYLINDLVYSLEDNCLTPSPIKELTKPCLLPKENLYEIIRDFIKRNINCSISKITSDYDFNFEVKDIRTGKQVFKMQNDVGHRDYTSDNFHYIIAKNFEEMLVKVDEIKRIIIDHINYDEKVDITGFIYIKESIKPLNIEEKINFHAE